MLIGKTKQVNLKNQKLSMQNKRRKHNVKTKQAKAKFLHAFLVDPYLREVIRCGVGRELDDWRKVLRCEYVEHILVSRDPEKNCTLDMWVDEEFLLHEKLAPTFRFKTAYSTEFVVIHGYALILAGDCEGESRSVFITAPEFLELFTCRMELQFERYEDRKDNLGPVPFVDEIMRNIELEAPDSFKYNPEMEDVESFDE